MTVLEAKASLLDTVEAQLLDTMERPLIEKTRSDLEAFLRDDKAVLQSVYQHQKVDHHLQPPVCESNSF